jgi:hypothetical protein
MLGSPFAEEVTLLVAVLEVPISILDLDTDYPDMVFLSLFRKIPRQ